MTDYQTFMGSSFITSIGTAVPSFKISQELHQNILISANGMDRAGRLMLKNVYGNSGIDSRHSVLGEFGHGDAPGNLVFHPAGTTAPATISKRMEIFEQHAADLCVEATVNCLADGHTSIKEITHLITFSCTGMSAPGIDIQMIEKLGLDRSIERTSINFMGCYAGINALRTASYIVGARPDAVVLVTGVELCTIHYQKNMLPDQLIANAIFADGASSVIVRSTASKPCFRMLSFYSEFEPSGINEMAWRIGDHGFDIRLSTYVPDLIQNNISTLLNKFFTKAGIGQSEIDWFALHPGGVKILEACEHALRIPAEANRHSYDVLKEYGNMSSVTIFFVLKKFIEQIKIEDSGKKLLSCAFGPGLTMECMILEVT